MRALRLTKPRPHLAWLLRNTFHMVLCLKIFAFCVIFFGGLILTALLDVGFADYMGREIDPVLGPLVPVLLSAPLWLWISYKVAAGVGEEDDDPFAGE